MVYYTMNISDWLAISIVLSLQTIGSLLSIIVGIYLTRNSSDVFTPWNLRQNNTTIADKNKKIDIDETKVVMNIDTTKLEKKFTNIAEQKTVDTDISGSVNKLKQMKG